MRWQIRLTVERDSAACGPDLGQGRLDVAVGQATDPARDHQRLQRVGPGHSGAEQPGAERLVSAAELRALQGDVTHGGAHRGRRLPAVAAARRAILLAALVAGTAEERVDLGLQGGLHQQPHADAGDVLQDRGEVTAGGEQLVDLGTQPVGG
jgi:hypothetical protein